MKWKKKALLCAAALLLAAGIRFPAAAEESEFPQLTFEKTLSEYTIESGSRKFEIQFTDFETRTLGEEDFKDELVLTERDIDTISAYAEEGKVITAGLITGKLKEGQNTYGFKSMYYVNEPLIDFWDYNSEEYKATAEIYVSVSGGEGAALTYDEWAWLGDPSTFCVAPTLKGGHTGLWYILTYKGKDYLVNIPVEIQCEDFLGRFENESVPEFIIYKKDTSGYSRNGLGLFSYTRDGDSFICSLDTYNENWMEADAIQLPYGYGASGVGDQEVKLADGRSERMLLSDTPFVQRDEPFSFTVQNSKGETQTYSIEVSMPWELTVTIENQYRDAIQSFQVDGQPMDYSRRMSLSFGQKVEVAINPPSGKKLSKAILTLSDKTHMEVDIQGDSFSFSMPKDTVSIDRFEYVDAEESLYEIRTETALDEDVQMETSGVVFLYDEEGVPTSRAAEGDEITARADVKSNHRSLYGFAFSHWEAEGIELTEEQKTSGEITFSMPGSEVRLKAFYKRTGTELTIGTDTPNGGTVTIQVLNVGHIDLDEAQLTDKFKNGQTYELYLHNPNFLGYDFLGWKDADGKLYDTEKPMAGVEWAYKGDASSGKSYICPKVTPTEDSGPMTFIASFRAKTAGILTLQASEERMGSVSASVEGSPVQSGETVLYDGQTISLTAEPKTGYLFDRWETENASVAFADADAAETTFVMPATAALTVRAVFKADPDYKSSECSLTRVELLKSDGTLVKQADREGTAFTVRLSASEMTAEEAKTLASGGYRLRLTYSEKATAALTGGYGDGDSPDDTWAEGISNPISSGGSGTFVITAEDGTHTGEYTVSIRYDDRPVLRAGRAERTGDAEATVQFTSSSTGMYYYAVTEKDAGEPEISTDSVGVRIPSANKAVTISLSNLTAGAKDIYIVVKNDDSATDVKISDVLKMTIAEYDPDAVRYGISVMKTAGGTISADKTEAKEGETVTVTVTPDSGKRMKSGSLKYSQSSAPYAVVNIDETTKTFQMPAYELSISCLFEDASSGGDDGPAIGAYLIGGVSGVINNTTGSITITLPYGTERNGLKPVITLKDASSVSPASGEAVDLTSPVTYTVTAEDGTTKTYTVTAYVEAQPVADRLWEEMLGEIGGSTDHTGKNTWWEKARRFKRNNDYPEYW
ncbi:MAG: hypothetical protein Q4C82_08600 [Eubacteriales bacterium]|nr:hypothetical protein [Eubacteriales bacterium]